MKSLWQSDESEWFCVWITGLQVGETLATCFIADNILIFMFSPGLQCVNSIPVNSQANSYLSSI